MRARSSRRLAIVMSLSVLALGACGSGPSLAPYTLPPVPSDPPISIAVPTEVAAGDTFEAGWNGEETQGDFFVIVPAGATTWTETPESPYWNATIGNPVPLTAPTAAGEYEVWFLKGNLGTRVVIKARAPLTVT